MKQLITYSALLLLVACTQQGTGVVTTDQVNTIRSMEIDAAAYPLWVEENSQPLMREQVIGDLTYRFTRIPAELLAVREAGADASVAEMQEALSHYSELMYFRLEIIAQNHNGELLKKDLTDPAEYNRRITYSSFEIQKDISMELSGAPLPCAVCQFERSFDVAPLATYLLAFETDEAAFNNNNVNIVFNDRLFNNGIVRFAWNKGELNAYPSLKGTKK